MTSQILTMLDMKCNLVLLLSYKDPGGTVCCLLGVLLVYVAKDCVMMCCGIERRGKKCSRLMAKSVLIKAPQIAVRVVI